jgi:hypothetical protein
MRILQAENIAPIHLQAGDGIQLTYREARKPSTFARMFGERDEVTEHVLATETFNAPRVVDRIAGVALETASWGLSV